MKVYILYFIIDCISVDHPFYFTTKEECIAKGNATLSVPYEGYRCVVDYIDL